MSHSAEALLDEVAWLRRLALRLASDRDDADDLVQDTWIALWQRTPADDRPLRPWLAKVLRDTAKMHRRGDARRRARESAVSEATVREAVARRDSGTAALDGFAPEVAHVASPEQLLAQARLYRTIVELVLALDEPYRTTVLAHYVEGTSCAELARQAAIPEATVRWRLAEAIRRLRDALDRRARRRWLLAPILLASKAKVVTGVVGIVLVLAALLLLLGRLGLGGHGGHGGGSGGAPFGTVPLAHANVDHRAGGSGTASWLVPADANMHAIVGHVIDENGAPIAGALVRLQSWGGLAHADDGAPISADRERGTSPDAVRGGTDDDRAITAHDGSFRLTPTWATRAFVVASAADHAAQIAAVDPRTLRDADDLVIVLAGCERTIEGLVTDAGGGPIAGATIRKLPANGLGPFGVSVASNADGRYRMCTPGGHAWFDIGAEGYEHVLRELDIRGRQRVDVALVPGASITGRVVETGTNRPLANVQVSLWPITRRSGESGDRSALSDGDGRFTIDGLGINRYQLTAWDRDHARTVIDEVAIEVGRQPRPLEVHMDPGVEVAGHVVMSDAPVPGARVTFQLGTIEAARHFGGTAASTFDVVTDRDGAFVLHGVPIGDVVVPNVTGYVVRTPTSIDTHHSIANLVLDVTALPTLHGHVTRDGIAIANAHVQAIRAGGEINTVDADSHGAYTISGLVAGTYRVMASSDRVGAFTIEPIVVDVPHDADLDLELDGGATITGTVVDEHNTAVVGAIVEARRDVGEDSGSGLTSTTGGFTIDQLAGGTYALRVLARPGAPQPLGWAGSAPAAVHLAGGHAHAGPLTLAVIDAEHAITGTVVDHDGAPVADAIVRLGPTIGIGDVPIARTTTDGRFTLAARGDGPFTLDAGTGTGPRATLANIPAGATDVVIKLVTPGTIEGTLEGLTDARIVLRRVNGIAGAASARDLRTTNADSDHFAFDGLVPGDYVVTAMSPRSANEAVTTHLDEGATVHVVLRAHPTRTIYGRVSRTNDDSPVGGIACVAAAAVGDNVPPGLNGIGVPRTTADASGNFAIANAPANDAIVVCYGGAYSRADVSNGATRVVPGAVAAVRVAPISSVWHDPGFEVDGGRLTTHVTTVEGIALLPGDIIVAVDGADVRSLYSQTVFWLAANHPHASLTVLRGGIELAVEAR